MNDPHGNVGRPDPDRRGPRAQRGDVFWVGVNARLDQSVAHPHVVVQDRGSDHAWGATVVMCRLSTRVRRADEPGNVRLDPGEGGLPLPSVVIVSQLVTVDISLLGPYVGTLSSARVDQVLAGVRFQQALLGQRRDLTGP